jgi:NTE family protein
MTSNDLKNKSVGVVFSSGFFGFFAHAGCYSALEELGINPAGYAGSSSGAIIAAFAAAGVSANSLRDILFSLQKKHIWDPEPWYKTLFSACRLFKGYLGYLEGKRFKGLLETFLPVKCFEDLIKPCVIVAANISKKQREIFTSGTIVDAVYASGAIPWTFKMPQIHNDYFLDGGLIDKAPLEALCTHINPQVIIVHYITSHELTRERTSFLSRRFSPQSAFRLAMSIERHEHYCAQKKIAEQQGAVIIELKPVLPKVTPDHLERGREAFIKAYEHTVKELKSWGVEEFRS